MLDHLLPILVTGLAAVLCGVLLVVATRPELLAGMVQPFAPSANPADDTLSEQAMVSTVLTDDGGWKVVTLSRLCDVEELLDCLEASGCVDREVHTFGNSTFAVRWK